MNEELRCYTFTHFILSSIQQGIQSGHASMELVNKYMVHEGWINGFAEQVNDWIKNHKTMICLHGGNSATLEELLDFLQDENNPFPVTAFYEDEQTAKGLMTSVAIILPARIFETAELMRRRTLPDGVSYMHDRLLNEHRFSFFHVEGGVKRTETYSEWEYELMVRLNSTGLAR